MSNHQTNHSKPTEGRETDMKALILFIAWCILFVLSWPLAVLALILLPLVWLVSLPLRLIGIGVRRLGCGERADRFQKLSGGPHIAGDKDSVAGHLTGNLGGTAVNLDDSTGQAITVQSKTRSSEAAGQDDVGAGGNIGAMQSPDSLRLLKEPSFGSLSRLQTFSVYHGPTGAVGQQHAAGSELC